MHIPLLMTPLDALVAFGLALLASLVLTPLAAGLASRLGAVDAPDGRRKKQDRPVPLGGGLAIALAAAMAAAVGLLWLDGTVGGRQLNFLHSALPSAIILVAVGLLDDTVGLTGIYKLLGQLIAASLLVAGGFQFQVLSFAGWSIPLGDFGFPFSLFFCLGAINAFNLIDGADALAASIGAVVCATLGVIAGSQGAVNASLASFAMAGALVGFLRYNAPPARVYLGDTGSMLIGWLVAAVAIRSSIKEQAAVALTVPIAICAIPILDAAAALVRRVTTGQSVFTADRGHLHHALLLRGWTVGQTAAMAAGLTAITCAGAIASYFTQIDWFAVFSAGCVVLTLAAFRIFGHAEAALVATHLRAMTLGVWRRLSTATTAKLDPTDHAVQIQGRRHWKIIWSALREAAPVYRLASLKLNVNIPHLHESFFASWKDNDVSAGVQNWRITVPLLCGDRPIGKLHIEGTTAGAQALVDMQQFLEFLEPIDAEIAQMAEDVEVLLGEEHPPITSLARPKLAASGKVL